MIKADELREFRPQVRYQNGEGITLMTVQEAIKDCAMKMGIPVAFRWDQVKSGGLFNSSVEDCLVIYHPEHERDYFKFCIRVRRQGVYAFVDINEFGESKQMNKAYRSELAKEGAKGYLKAGDEYEAGKMAGKVIGGLIGSLGKSKAKLEEEQMYYQCVFDIFDEIVR
jgi:hypothetical protein